MCRFANVIASICLLAIVVIVTIGVFLRYVLRSPSADINDWVALLVVPASLLAMANTERFGGHVRVELLRSHLPTRTRRCIDRILSAIGAALCGWLCYASFQEGLSLQMEGVRSVQARLGLWYGQWCIATAFGLLAVQLCLRTLVAERMEMSTFENDGSNQD